MSEQELTPEEEAVLAPVSFELMTTVNGTTIGSRCFIRQSVWDELEGEEAQAAQIEVSLQEMAKAVVVAVRRSNLVSGTV